MVCLTNLAKDGEPKAKQPGHGIGPIGAFDPTRSQIVLGLQPGPAFEVVEDFPGGKLGDQGRIMDQDDLALLNGPASFIQISQPLL